MAHIPTHPHAYRHSVAEQGAPKAPHKDRDPVCGMVVAVESPYHAHHDGHAYRFCSARCREKFLADPARYFTPAATPASPPQSPGISYTCPMHPQIVRDYPGACPICGMALEPMAPSLGEGEHPELVDFRRRFRWTLPLSLAVLILAMFGHRLPGLTVVARTWLELALSAPVVLWAGWTFWVRGVQSLQQRSPNMWTLIATGVGAAFSYSLVATLVPEVFPESFREHGRVGVYYEAAAIIVSLTLLGQILELKAGRTHPRRSGLCLGRRRRQRAACATMAAKKMLHWRTCGSAIACAFVPAKRCPWTARCWRAAAR